MTEACLIACLPNSVSEESALRYAPAVMQNARYTFGPFVIDSDHRLLFRDGERVSLPPKAADVLIALVEREGELVGKSELLEQVWPDTFVEEGSLARHIFLLRKTLGETKAGVSYVETVPKRGYRFMGRVQREDPNTIAFTTEERTAKHIIIEETETKRLEDLRPRRRTVVFAFSTVAATCLGWSAAAYFLRERPKPALGRFARWRYCHSGCSAAILKTNSWNWESQTRSFRS